MHFNKNSAVLGKHALLSASKYHWINYDEDKLSTYFESQMAAQKGTELHAFAHDAIRLKIKLPDNNKTLNAYVNDAIGYRMIPEQPLFYSENCFGTPDAISYSIPKRVLRISDLKTGTTPASEKQLMVYAAIFFLEYGKVLDVKPFDVHIELRVYQNDEVRLYIPEATDIVYIMDKIITFDKHIKAMREEAGL